MCILKMMFYVYSKDDVLYTMIITHITNTTLVLQAVTCYAALS